MANSKLPISRNRANDILSEFQQLLDRITDQEVARVMVLAWASLANDRTQAKTMVEVCEQLLKLPEMERECLYAFMISVVRKLQKRDKR